MLLKEQVADVQTDTGSKIFVSQEPVLCKNVEQWPSLGHYLIDRLTNHHAETRIYLDHESGRQWTGSQIKIKVLNVASALVDHHNFKPGSLVCINYDNSDLTVILALAVIVAGGAVACCYHKDPYPELLYLARKVEPKFIFSYGSKLDEAERLSQDLGYHVEAIVMGDDPAEAAKHEQFSHFKHLLDYDYTKSKCFGRIPVECQDLKRQVAFITMSSGTTGLPKAIPLTQYNCISDLANYRRSSGPKINMACCASLDYVSGRIITLGALQTGYTAIIMNGFEARVLLEAIERHKINVIYIGAASFYKFITHKDFDKFDLSSLRMVFPMGAKVIYLDEMRDFFRKNPNIISVRQGYGCSEVSGGSMNAFTPEEYLNDSDNCGKLLAGVQAKIVDPQSGKLLGKNQCGILHLRGPVVFPGYYDMERARKIQLEASSNGQDVELSPYYINEQIFDQDGFYITGDLAHFNDKEELYIHGRQNELMTCRDSLKVLPQELEELIDSHPAVSSSTVLGIANRVDLTIHCPRAFVVPKAGCYSDDESEATKLIETPRLTETRDPERLNFIGRNTLSRLADHRRRLLAKDLMSYLDERVAWAKQLTGGIVILDEIPTSRATGKVDKNYLRSLTLEHIEIYGSRDR